MPLTQVPLRYSFLLATAVTVLLAGTSLLVGADSAATGERLEMIVTTLRIPRMFAALLAGVALGAGGVLLQTATRNPLAETGLLGVNSGAALGVVLGVSFAGAESGYEYLIYALGGAMLASAAVLAIASTGRASPLRLILAGAAIGATLRGITGYLLLRNTAGFDQYRFWTLGSLSGVDNRMVLHAAPFVAGGLLLAGFMVRPLSALALGDEAARALGHHPGRVRVLVAIAVTLLAAASVAIAGPIAFLGLLAPWLARAVAGPAVAAQLFLAAVFGAGLLLLADTLARVIVRPYEVPASVLIAIAGAPLLVWAARNIGRS